MLNPNKNNDSFNYEGREVSIPDDCPFFRVQSLIKNITANEEDSILLYVNDRGKKFNAEIPTSLLNDLSNLIKALNANNIFAKHYQVHDISMLLTHQARVAFTSNYYQLYHTKLGWHNIDGQYYFLYDQTNINGKVSECKRDFLFEAGDVNKYQEMLNKHVFPRKELALAYCLGFSAVVISLINKLRIADLGTIVLNVSGKSSTGKSTMEQLLLSPFGSPVFTKHGLGLPHSGTLNGFLDALEGIHGLPRVIDDLQQNSNINLTELLYTISQEETKMRCGEKWNRNIDGWSGIVIASSETPLMESMKVQQGTYPRLLNATNVQWTESAESAEEIKTIVNANYGLTGKTFIDYIVSMPIETLKSDYEKALNKVKSLMTKKDGLSDRIATRLASIYLSCELVKQCFNSPFTWTTEELIEPLIESEQDTVDDRNPAEKLLNIIKTYAQEYKYSRFDVNYLKTHYKGNGTFSNETIAKQTNEGIINIKDDEWTVIIHEDRLKKILKAEGFNEWGTATNELKKRGILIGTEEKKKNGKTTIRTRKLINGIWCNVFKFKMESEQIQEDLTEENQPKQPVQLEMKVDNTNWNDDDSINAFFKGDDDNA